MEREDELWDEMEEKEIITQGNEVTQGKKSFVSIHLRLALAVSITLLRLLPLFSASSASDFGLC